MEWVWVPKIRNLLLFNCLCGFFIDAMVLFFCEAMDVIVWKFADLFVRAHIGYWQLMQNVSPGNMVCRLHQVDGIFVYLAYFEELVD